MQDSNWECCNWNRFVSGQSSLGSYKISIMITIIHSQRTLKFNLTSAHRQHFLAFKVQDRLIRYQESGDSESETRDWSWPTSKSAGEEDVKIKNVIILQESAATLQHCCLVTLYWFRIKYLRRSVSRRDSVFSKIPELECLKSLNKMESCLSDESESETVSNRTKVCLLCLEIIKTSHLATVPCMQLRTISSLNEIVFRSLRLEYFSLTCCGSQLAVKTKMLLFKLTLSCVKNSLFLFFIQNFPKIGSLLLPPATATAALSEGKQLID